jgi:hypothetical protein
MPLRHAGGTRQPGDGSARAWSHRAMADPSIRVTASHRGSGLDWSASGERRDSEKLPGGRRAHRCGEP